MVRLKIAQSTICTLLLTIGVAQADIIFDLGGVLIDTNQMASLRSIGLKNIVLSMFQLKQSPRSIKSHLKRKLFATLDMAACEYGYTTDVTAYDEDGERLPYFMVAWLAGTMKCADIKECVAQSVHNNPTFFASSGEKAAIENMITMIFTPEAFVKTRKMYTKGINFITACKERGHRVYCLSNWDEESFALLRTKYASLFDLFDGIVISGEVNQLKPSPAIYETLVTRYNLDKNQCWFIDDQKENVAAAQKVGINAILCEHVGPIKKPNYQKIAHNIHDYDYKSVTRRENRSNNGSSDKKISSTSSPIIVGENIS